MNSRKKTYTNITKAAESATYVLSFQQERIWYLSKLIPENTYWNRLSCKRLKGKLDSTCLSNAVTDLLQRHSVLNIRLVTDTRGPRQLFQPRTGQEVLRIVDLTGPGFSCRETEVMKFLDSHSRNPIRLESDPLFQVYLIRLSDAEQLLLLKMHHIISDATTFQILWHDLKQLYNARCGAVASLTPLTLAYQDYAVWQRQEFDENRLAAEEKYWLKRLAGERPALSLPVNFVKPAHPGFRGAMEKILVEKEFIKKLEGLSLKNKAALYSTLLAAYFLLLYKYAHEQDLTIGTVFAGRHYHPELRKMAGFFVNTVAIRMLLQEQQTFIGFLEEVHTSIDEAYAMQDYPFERAIRQLNPERTQNRNPLFNTIFNLLTYYKEQAAFDRITEEVWVPVEVNATQVDLTLEVHIHPEHAELRLEYNSDLFQAEIIRRLLKHYLQVLRTISNAPHTRLSAFQLMDEEEFNAWSAFCRGPRKPFAENTCMHELFEARVANTPGAKALSLGKATLTYAELNRRANCLAHRLRRLGVGPGVLVGLYLDRSFEMITGMLAVQKAGGAYVPLELFYPRERVKVIVEAAGVKALITKAAFREKLPALAVPLLCADEKQEEDVQADYENLSRVGTSADPAYVIYTSGSTGMPKGVVIRHRAAINLIEWVNRTFNVGPADCLLFTTSYCFDLSVYDTFGILASGGTVRIASEAELAEPQKLVDIMLHEPVTFWDSAPARMQQLTPFFPGAAAPAGLRLVFLSGDWIPVALPDLIRKAFPRAQIISLGGATEATVWSNWYPIGKVGPNWPSIPYGKPIQNCSYYILDKQLQPCPVGVPGDLYIAGDCLFSEYLKDPEKSNEKLIPNPFVKDPNSLMYYTGDLARFLPDGNMEFLGRKDFQVKLHGYRIELGEIESVLNNHPDVRQSLVLLNKEQGQNAQLVAYVVLKEPRMNAGKMLKEHLSRHLPDYMVPRHVLVLHSIPLTPNGKIDRRALPAPETQSQINITKERPRNPVEEALCGIWLDLLKTDNIDIRDNFFDLGGHSLLAGQAVIRVREKLNVEIPMVKILQLPTIAQLGEYIDELKKEKAAANPAMGLGGEREIGRI